MEKNPLGLIIKHVGEGGTFYIAAHYVEHVVPRDGNSTYVAFDAGDREISEGIGCREIRSGVVYVMNSSGKTIDIIRPGQIAPKIVDGAA